MADRRRLDLRNPFFGVLPVGAGTPSPSELVQNQLNPPPDPEDYLEYKAITVRPTVEIVAFLEGLEEKADSP